MRNDENLFSAPRDLHRVMRLYGKLPTRLLHETEERLQIIVSSMIQLNMNA